MKKIFFFCAGIFFSQICWAESFTSSQLISDAKNLDGKTVEYQGEIVGEILWRQGFCWINLKEAEAAIGVWTPRRDAEEEIRIAGNYNFRGDTIWARGVFHHSCPEHGGDLDIHALQLKKISSGFALKHCLSPERKKWLFVFAFILIFLILLNYFRNNLSRLIKILVKRTGSKNQW
jgi:hypothetical protein